MTWLQGDSPNQNPDWTAIGVTIGGLLTAIGTPIALWNTYKNTKKDAASLTLDGVFKLVDYLQKEDENKIEEIKNLTNAIEAQKIAYEKTIARQLEVIQIQAEENRQLRLKVE